MAGRLRPLADPDVQAVFDAYPRDIRSHLLSLRALIFEVAAAHDAIGPLIETLKWRQPAYLPAMPRVGTTIRIDALKDGRIAMFVHCRTTLVDRFRAAYPGLFTFDGKRAVIFDRGAKLPMEALRHCIAMALTYRVKRLAG